LLEEIVGEISDEHELVSEPYVVLKQGGWLMNGGMTLEEVSEVIGIDFEAEEANTLGGFVIERLQHLPKKGERIFYKKYFFQVQEASPKRVLRVLVYPESSAV
jgi:putative hemolysin